MSGRKNKNTQAPVVESSVQPEATVESSVQPEATVESSVQPEATVESAPVVDDAAETAAIAAMLTADEQTAPVESTATQAAPVESTATQAAPVEPAKAPPIKVIKNPKWRSAVDKAVALGVTTKYSAKEAYIWQSKGGVWYPHQLDGIDQNATFDMVIAANPKKQQAAKRFGKVRNGMTVKAYIAACERYDGPKVCLNDLTWDLNRGFYRLVLVNEAGDTTIWNKHGVITVPATVDEGDGEATQDSAAA